MRHAGRQLTLLLADARRLPFPDKTFDLLFFSPPWDNLSVLDEARPELERVLNKRGRFVMVLPHADYTDQATLLFANRDWTERQSFVCEEPRELRGPRYFSMRWEFVMNILAPWPRDSFVLDPFAGVGTVPLAAERMGFRNAYGCDIDREALCRSFS